MNRMQMDDGVSLSAMGEVCVNEFTEKSATRFREQVLNRASIDPDAPIVIYIDSYGGYVDSLAKMIETMHEVPNKFITVCMGKAISCGAILLSHGDVRYCGGYSRVMIHNVSSGSWGDIYSLKVSSNQATKMNEKFMGLLANSCGLTYDELQNKIKTTVSNAIRIHVQFICNILRKYQRTFTLSILKKNQLNYFKCFK